MASSTGAHRRAEHIPVHSASGAGRRNRGEDEAPGPGRARHERPRRRRRVGLWIAVGAFVVVCAAGVYALLVGKAAFEVRDQLEASRSSLASATGILRDRGPEGGPDALAALEDAARAAGAADDAADSPWMRSAARLPWVGNNFTTVGAVAEQAHGVLDAALPPAHAALEDGGAGLLHDGAFDLDRIRSVADGLPALAARTGEAAAAIESLPDDGLLAPVATARDEVSAAIAEVRPTLDSASALLPLVTTLLGADGPQNYLLLFQNIAEVRAFGGNPASLMLVHVEDGRLTLAAQASSGDFPNFRNSPVIDLPEGAYDVLSPNVSRVEMDMTGYPDFPTVAAMAQEWWRLAGHDDHIDHVAAIDPVALGYLLRATGPVELPDGDTLTSDNAAQRVLSDVYERYPVPTMQDAYFAAAGASIFDALTSSSDLDLRVLVAALDQAASEHRILLWSSNPAVQEIVVERGGISGVIPADDASRTTTGVFLWDSSAGGSKFYYHVDNSNTVERAICPATGAAEYAVTVTVASALSRAEALALPGYVVTDSAAREGRFGADITVLAPEGAVFDRVEVVDDGGGHVDDEASGTLVGRSAVRVPTRIPYGSAATVRVIFTADHADADAELVIRSSPLVRPVTNETTTVERCG